MDDEEYNTSTTQVAFQKLRAEAGDVIVISFPEETEHEQMEEFGRSIQPVIPDGVTILCALNGVTVDSISEFEMNKMGWYKFDNDKGKAN